MKKQPVLVEWELDQEPLFYDLNGSRPNLNNLSQFVVQLETHGSLLIVGCPKVDDPGAWLLSMGLAYMGTSTDRQFWTDVYIESIKNGISQEWAEKAANGAVEARNKKVPA